MCNGDHNNLKRTQVFKPYSSNLAGNFFEANSMQAKDAFNLYFKCEEYILESFNYELVVSITTALQRTSALNFCLSHQIGLNLKYTQTFVTHSTTEEGSLTEISSGRSFCFYYLKSVDFCGTLQSKICRLLIITCTWTPL